MEEKGGEERICLENHSHSREFGRGGGGDLTDINNCLTILRFKRILGHWGHSLPRNSITNKIKKILP